MLKQSIALPSKPKIDKEEKNLGIYEVEGLYPGYGHTLGNSLRRIIISSLPGAAITSVKIDGVSHEFSVKEGIKEDIITILLNLKKVRLQVTSREPQTVTLKVKGAKEVTAADIDAPTQVEVMNPEQHIATITDKNTELSMEMTVEKGLGYVARDDLQKGKVDIGTIALDAVFTPIRRANYEVENMRVGDRTDFNRLKMIVETDGTISPREAFEDAINIMIQQLQAITGFKGDEEEAVEEEAASEDDAKAAGGDKETQTEVMKTRVEDLELGSRTYNALSGANIRTVGGLARKSEEDLLDVEGLGQKGLDEIKSALKKIGVSLKE